MIWRRSIVRTGTPTKEAIKAMDASGLQAALVVDPDGVFLGILTDGDVRRAILDGQDLSSPVDIVMQGRPRTIRADTGRAAARNLLRELDIAHLPILDFNNRLVGLETLRDHFDLEQDSTWVVIMAGGFGRRLSPITDTIPKPLVPIHDRPILQHIVESVARRGFTRIFLSINYKGEMIKNHFGDGSKWGVRIEYVEEDEPRGTAGALSLLKISDDDQPKRLLVMNGDILTNLDFQALISFHSQQENPATMCVRENSIQIPYGVVQFDGPYIAQIVEKPVHTCFINAGVYVLDARTLSLVPKGEFFDMPSLFKKLVATGERPGVFPVREYWLDIGSHGDLERARNDYRTLVTNPAETAEIVPFSAAAAPQTGRDAKRA